jgi:hypothetical protein
VARAVGPVLPSASGGGAAWQIIGILPAHPIITGPVAAAATGRFWPQIYQAIDQLESAGVLEAVSESRRNRSCVAAGLLELLEGLESAEPPPHSK